MITDPISVEKARATVMRHFVYGGLADAPGDRVVAIRRDAAVGFVLAESVGATEDIPPFDNSAMDGYAVRTADLTEPGSSLEVGGEIRAGEPPGAAVQPGECIRVMTGAVMPPGADAVAPVEWTSGWGDAGDAVQFERIPDAGQHVRRAGRDVGRGQSVFEVGTVITPPVIGMLAALGLSDVRVYRKPSVSIVATGDELVSDGSQLSPGQIRNSNGPGLAAQVRFAGASLADADILVARDNEASIRESIEQALQADIVLVSGGVSVGAYDLVRPVLESMDVEILFWRVRQRPGKPLAFGRGPAVAVFGLPGNPVSSAVCFEQYVRPAIARFSGVREQPRLMRAALEEPVEKKPDLHYFSRGIAHRSGGVLRVRLAGEQGSNIYSSMVSSNCMIHLPEGPDRLQAGEHVMVEPYSWASWV